MSSERSRSSRRVRSVEDLQHMRLMALLGELVRDKGVMKAAESLDVDHRTLTSAAWRAAGCPGGCVMCLG